MKMPEAIGSQLFAPCGMNCMVCFAHCSTKKACGGCLGTDESKPGHCRTCLRFIEQTLRNESCKSDNIRLAGLFKSRSEIKRVSIQ